jgi:uncharacterized protein (DUF885 family)
MPRFCLALATISMLAACSYNPPQTVVDAPPTSTDKAMVPAGAQLKQLFTASDEAMLKRNPLSALYRGDLRYADQLGEFFTDSYFAGERAAATSDLATLQQIDRASLNPTDQIAYDMFAWQSALNLKATNPELVRLQALRPLDHFYGIHTWYPDIASGQGAASFKTLADYDNNLKRNQQFIGQLDRAIGRMREGIAAGIVQPKLIVNNMLEQLELQLKQGVQNSTFMGPVKQFPEAISMADQARLKADYTAFVSTQLIPKYQALHRFLRDEYLPKARSGVGLVHMPGGTTLYNYLIESNTTLPLTADEIHQTGLNEVARIKGEMEVIRQKVGFKGNLKAFFEHFRTSPKFRFSSPEAMRDSYYAIGRKVDERVREQFSLIPKSPLEIRRVPAYREKTDAGGSYMQGTPDGSRPGIFYFNAYDLPSRNKMEAETLYLHEAIPGHHFQISLAQENLALPNFMRFGGNTAYVEGWALYAESLWQELGVESDPYSRFGGLNDEMLRAVRLVVDTGLHAKGWTREQAIAYMLDNSGQSANDARAEIERYIAIPGQALAYKIGQLTILQLKAKAQSALGAKFDPRAFHAQVLDSGALSMGVLQSKIDGWIAAEKAKG